MLARNTQGILILVEQLTLKEAVVTCRESSDTLIFSDDQAIQFGKREETPHTERVGFLRVRDVYEQKYLLAHTMESGL